MAKLPTWVTISLGVVLFLVLGIAAGIKLVLEEPPGYTDAPAIQARFAEQLDILMELARTNPSDGCAPYGSPDELIEEMELMKPWLETVREVRSRFDDPAILGAKVVSYCDSSTSSFGVKSYEEFSGAWSLSWILADREWPSISVWRAGDRKLVRYDDRLTDPEGTPRGISLILDVAALADPFSCRRSPVSPPGRHGRWSGTGTGAPGATAATAPSRPDIIITTGAAVPRRDHSGWVAEETDRRVPFAPEGSLVPWSL